MPIIDDLNLSPKTRVVIWEINESFQDLQSKVDLSQNSLKLLNQKNFNRKECILLPFKTLKKIVSS